MYVKCFLYVVSEFSLINKHILLNKHWYFLTGMQVLSNPLITVCEQMEVMNSSGEYSAERGSGMMGNDTAGMMANDTARGGNETCIRCGKIGLSEVFRIF